MISSKLRRVNGYKQMHCKCQCGKKAWVDYSSLVNGVSKGCKSCGHTYSKHQEVLGRRYDAITSRCGNPANPAWARYGGRGIECRFASRKDFVLWVEQNLPHLNYRSVEIDRIDNNGHYEPGNLRLASRRAQMANRENTLWVQWQGNRILLKEFDSPYSMPHTALLVNQGLTGEQIIWRAVMDKSLTKGWQRRAQWLEKHESMILAMLVPGAASQ